MSRRRALAAFPSVIGGPEYQFRVRSSAAVSPRASAHIWWAGVKLRSLREQTGARDKVYL